MAALLHRAADMEHKPTIRETKFLLPKPALSARDIKPPQWVSMVRRIMKHLPVTYSTLSSLQVQTSWEDIHEMSPGQAKAQVLEILSAWPLFGSSFFAVRL